MKKSKYVLKTVYTGAVNFMWKVPKTIPILTH